MEEKERREGEGKGEVDGICRREGRKEVKEVEGKGKLERENEEKRERRERKTG